ncbi:MAG: bifunctional folylpolyglutamate synthase/dihydrofolate synthase [Chloroflexi bacterium]|nr:bifunctional folylpolyglutamate synthase/dihydrofolate synthase [Chloroflexota bacterium]
MADFAAAELTREAALAWLYQFSDWERGVGWNSAAAPEEQWKLGRTRRLLDLVGGPDRALRCVLIAGTNGKGSTAAMLEAVERAAGWRTGLYSQPHLHSYLERIKLDGEPIEGERFAKLVERLRPLVDRFRAAWPQAGEPTTFELTTVLALWAFAEAKVDIAILEVGLGGRLDATNAVEPILSVITRIGRDHTAILGDSIEQIAQEKAGVLRPGRVVVVAPQRSEARRAIVRRGEALGARCRLVSSGGRIVDEEGSGADIAVRLQGRRVTVRVPMAGRHQLDNAATALVAADELGDFGLTMTPVAVQTGLERLRMPGRFEVVPGRPRWVLDVAHNPDSAVALASVLGLTKRSRLPWLVLGMLGDKDARSVVRALRQAVGGIVVTAPMSPRALPVDSLAEVCHKLRVASVTRAASVAEAIGLAARAAGPDGTVVVAGSFGVVAEARVGLGLVTAEDWPGADAEAATSASAGTRA